jgi:AhpD family alkylhydroperoxidase
VQPLVEVLDQSTAPLLAQPYFAGGDPGPIAATMAHVPELLEPALSFIGPTLSPGGLDWRTKEIVIVRTSALLGCRYCVDSHTTVALDAGLSHDEVRALRGDTELHVAFDAADDRLLLQWIDAVAAGRGPIDDDLSARTAALFPAGALVELTLLIGATMLLNRYATSLRLPVSDGVIARLAAEGFDNG